MAKPEVTIPDADPPSGLVIDDLVVGDGDEATAGSDVEVHWHGRTASSSTPRGTGATPSASAWVPGRSSRVGTKECRA
jgi:FKBP-type peptidyl-prolyl cis-trans isomerase